MTDDLIARLRECAKAWPIFEDIIDGKEAASVVQQAATALEALTARIAELEAERAWRPIKKAPRDREILVARYWPSGKFRETIADTWTEDFPDYTGWLSGSVFWRDFPVAPLTSQPPPPTPETADEKPELCVDCPPENYPTDKTRCFPCPRRTPFTETGDAQ